MQLFVDLDGVLADFDSHYDTLFGGRPDKKDDSVDWKAIAKADKFFFNLPPMPDYEALWARVERHKPIILTGIPSSVPNAPDLKRAWVSKYIGPSVPVITCASKNKCNYASPGDVLIDDWEKHKAKWENVGGIWITHVNAVETAKRLTEIGL